MKNNRLFASFIGALFCTLAALSQQSVVSAGASISGTGGSVACSIGQVAYSMISGTNGFIIQGVQQPYEISTMTGIEVEDISLDCDVYPNPTPGMLRLVIGAPDHENFSFRLYDFNGKLIRNNRVSESETRISLEQLPGSVYFLKVIRDNTEVKVFKIVKR